MSDYDQRNQAFDYTPPSRGGSGGGALIFVAILVVLFVLAMLFMGGSSTLPADGAAPAAPLSAPTVGEPVVDPTAPAAVD